jgi:hypothetical protein
MTFSTSIGLTKIREMLDAIPGLEVHVGLPESFTTSTTSFVTMAGQRVYQKTVGSLWQREARYFRSEERRATILMRNALAASQNATNVTLDLGMGDTPDYQAQLGVEVRIYPAIITFTQQEQIG